jgi:hypothetical protein
MDYYENVVIDYLRADRALFVNTECCIQINPGDNPDTSGLHWYCDAVAADFRSQTVFLCEISYGDRLADLTKRLRGWHDNWDGVCKALARESFLPKPWPVRPWLFVREDRVDLLLKRMMKIQGGQPLKFAPRITPLEMVQPWRYRGFNRIGEAAKVEAISEAMAK